MLADNSDLVVFSIFLVFAGAAALSTLALYARQSLLVAYIVVGFAFGPAGAGLVRSPSNIAEIAHVGIIFLLFLLGLDLHPQKLLQGLSKSVFVTALSSAVFALIGFVVAIAFGLPFQDSLIVAASAMFSSTIIGVKLLPTTTLHHRRAGEIVISILLLQDIVAIVVLLILEGAGVGGDLVVELVLIGLYLPGLILLAFVLARYVIAPLMSRFDQIREYVFLVAIGWCLGLAELGGGLGLSEEIGAFIAGVALATSPIALYIVESLKPLRDFFLVMFFFALGAQMDPKQVLDVLLPATVLAAALLVVKPIVFRRLLVAGGENPRMSRELGIRLGQLSEFAFLITTLAMESAIMGQRGAYMIQLATMMTFVLSSYWVVQKYPTPIAVSEKLRRD